jgi:hypothetical protein
MTNELGRDALAALFFAEATNERCQTGALEVRQLGEAALCSYECIEEAPLLQAHHVSPLPGPG